MLAFVVLIAVLAAAATLPLGGAAHAVALRIAAPQAAGLLPLGLVAAAAGAAGAPLALVAPRWLRRAEAHPRADRLALLFAALGGAVGHASLAALTRDMAATPVGAGLGLLATSVALGSIGIAPAPSGRTLAGAPAAALGVALAAGALPGGSSLALGVAALVWSGLPEREAVEAAALGACPLHVATLVAALRDDTFAPHVAAPSLAAGAGALGLVVAILALAAALRVARASKLALFAAWTATVGFALLGYAFVAAPP